MSDNRLSARPARAAAPVAACLLALTGWAGSALAGPVNPIIQNGTVQIAFDDRLGFIWTITASNGAIVNYDSFDIFGNELVIFDLPTSASRMLNRITGDFDGTQINGTLASNGVIYFVNPAGVFFGNGAVINVGGIYAAAGTMTDGDFLAGMDRFSLSGTVENRGAIVGNLVHLLGANAANFGSIDVGSGVLTMVSGGSVVISPVDPNGHVMVNVAANLGAGNSAESGVHNSGLLSAPGGQIVLGAGDLFALAIRNDGVIDAAGGLVRMQSVDGDIVAGGDIGASGGAVEIAAGGQGSVAVDGAIFADSLDVFGDGITLGAGTISADTMRFDGPVVLAADTTLTLDIDAERGALPSVEFTSTVDSAAAAGYDLWIDHDLAMFGGAVGTGAGGRLGLLFVNGATHAAGGAISGGTIDLGDLLLLDDLTLDFQTEALIFGRIDSEASEFNDLTINALSAFFGGPVGDLSPDSLLGALIVNAPSQIATGTINTQSGVFFNDDVLLSQSAHINGGFSAFFGGDIQSTALDFHDLTVTAVDTFFNGTVGLLNPDTRLGTLETTAGGATTIGAASITTADEIIFGNDVRLGATTLLSAGDLIDFGGRVDSAGGLNGLTASAGQTRFGGQVGVVGALSNLTVNGAAVIDTDTIIAGLAAAFNGDVLLEQSASITGGLSVNFSGRLDSQDSEFNDLLVSSLSTRFGGAVGDLTPTSLPGTVHVESLGSTAIDTAVMTAQTALIFDNPVIIDRTATLTGGFSAIFNGTVNSRDFEFNGLTVNSIDTRFNQSVGAASGNSLLGRLTTDAAGTTTINAPLVTIQLNTIFNDDVVIAQDSLITSPLSMTFNGRLDSEAGEMNDLTIISFSTIFNRRVGGDPGLLASRSGEGSARFGAFTTDPIGSTTINTDSISGETITFSDDIIISRDLTIDAANLVTFNDVVNSSADEFNDLIVLSPVTVFNGQVGAAGGAGVAGGGQGLTMLGLLSTDADGLTTVNTTAVNAQDIVFGDHVIVDRDVTFTGLNRVHFDGRLNSQVFEFNDVIINSPDTRFSDRVGAGFPESGSGGTGGPSFMELGLLRTDANGRTVINTDVVNGTSLDFNDDVMLDASTTLTGTSGVDFAARVDSADFEFNNLTVNAPVTAFHGRVGDSTGLSQLGTLSTDSAGVTTIDTDKIVALFEIDMNDDIVLAQSTWITGGFTADFDGRIDSEAGEANGLLVTSQSTRFGGDVGNAGPDTRLGLLETDLSGTTVIDTGVIRSDEVRFNDAVQVATDARIDAALTTFGRTLDAADETSPELSIMGDAVFGGAVGGAVKLGAINVDGTAQINGGLVNADTQVYEGAVVLSGDTLISGDTQLVFRQTVDGPGALEVVGAGDALFAGDITLGSLTTALEGTLAFESATIDASGDVIFNDAIVLLDVPTLATIGSDGDLVIHAANFRMGRNQKLSVVGDLIIDVESGTVTLGDLSVLGFIDVTAGRIEMLLRLASSVERPDGTFIMDQGLDIIAGGTIRFSVVPTSLNPGGRPAVRFATLEGGGDANGNLRGFLMRDSGDIGVPDLMAADGRFFDLVATGSSNTNVAESFASPLPPDAYERIVIPEPHPGPVDRRRLDTDLSIPARLLDSGELVTLLAGRRIFFDTPDSSMDRSLQSSHVVVDRLILSKALGALELYDLILAGRSVEEVNTQLGAAWQAYLNGMDEKPDPAGLAMFLETAGDESTLGVLRLIKQLRYEIESMGITPPEARRPIDLLARRLMPVDVTPQVFNRILQGVE